MISFTFLWLCEFVIGLSVGNVLQKPRLRAEYKEFDQAVVETGCFMWWWTAMLLFPPCPISAISCLKTNKHNKVFSSQFSSSFGQKQ